MSTCWAAELIQQLHNVARLGPLLTTPAYAAVGPQDLPAAGWQVGTWALLLCRQVKDWQANHKAITALLQCGREQVVGKLAVAEPLS